jgi:hypothetical protein
MIKQNTDDYNYKYILFYQIDHPEDGRMTDRKMFMTKIG